MAVGAVVGAGSGVAVRSGADVAVGTDVGVGGAAVGGPQARSVPATAPNASTEAIGISKRRRVKRYFIVANPSEQSVHRVSTSPDAAGCLDPAIEASAHLASPPPSSWLGRRAMARSITQEVDVARDRDSRPDGQLAVIVGHGAH